MPTALLMMCCLLGQDAHAGPESPDGERMAAEADQAGPVAWQPSREQSFVSFLWSALGPSYALALFGSGALLLVGSLVVALLCRPPAIVAFLAFVPIPFLIGLFGVFEGAIASSRVIAGSCFGPKPSEVAEGISTSLATGFVGTGIVIPPLFILALALFLKTAAASSGSLPAEVYAPPKA